MNERIIFQKVEKEVKTVDTMVARWQGSTLSEKKPPECATLSMQGRVPSVEDINRFLNV